MAMLLQVPPPSSLLNSKNPQIRFFYSSIRPSSKKFRCRAVREKAEEIDKNNSPSPPPSAEEVTKKYGLEFGLWKVGISTNETGEKVGAFALAYAAHKAASPIGFHLLWL